MSGGSPRRCGEPPDRCRRAILASKHGDHDRARPAPRTDPQGDPSRVAAARRALAVPARTALVALHVVDDSFLQPPAGTTAADHLAGGLVPLALLAAAAWAHGRVRAGGAGCWHWPSASSASASAPRGRLLHHGRRPVRRRLHRAAGHPRRPAADRHRCRCRCGGHGAATGACADGSSAAGCWWSPRRWRRSSSRSRCCSPTPSRTSSAPTCPRTRWASRTRTSASRPPTGCACRAGTSRRATGPPSSTSRDGSAPRRPPGCSRGTATAFCCSTAAERAAARAAGNLLGWGGDKDIIAAVDWLKKRPDVDPRRIGGIGFSVGGELMLEAAAKDPDLAAVVSDGAGARQLAEEKKALRGRNFWTMSPAFALLNGAVAVFSDTAPPATLTDLVPRIAPRPLLFIWAPDGGNATEVLTPEYHRVAGRTRRCGPSRTPSTSRASRRSHARTSAGSSRSSTTRCSVADARPPTRKAPGQRPRRGAAYRSRTDDLRITSASL